MNRQRVQELVDSHERRASEMPVRALFGGDLDRVLSDLKKIGNEAVELREKLQIERHGNPVYVETVDAARRMSDLYQRVAKAITELADERTRRETAEKALSQVRRELSETEDCRKRAVERVDTLQTALDATRRELKATRTQRDDEVKIGNAHRDELGVAKLALAGMTDRADSAWRESEDLKMRLRHAGEFIDRAEAAMAGYRSVQSENIRKALAGARGSLAAKGEPVGRAFTALKKGDIVEIHGEIWEVTRDQDGSNVNVFHHRGPGRTVHTSFLADDVRVINRGCGS